MLAEKYLFFCSEGYYLTNAYNKQNIHNPVGLCNYFADDLLVKISVLVKRHLMVRYRFTILNPTEFLHGIHYNNTRFMAGLDLKGVIESLIIILFGSLSGH